MRNLNAEDINGKFEKRGGGSCVVKVFEISGKFVRIGGKHVEWQWV